MSQPSCSLGDIISQTNRALHLCKKKKITEEAMSWHLQISLIPRVLWMCAVLGELHAHRADFCCHQNWPSIPQEAPCLSATMTGKGVSLQPRVLRCAARQAMFNPDGAAGSHEFLKVKQLT